MKSCTLESAWQPQLMSGCHHEICTLGAAEVRSFASFFEDRQPEKCKQISSLQLLREQPQSLSHSIQHSFLCSGQALRMQSPLQNQAAMHLWQGEKEMKKMRKSKLLLSGSKGRGGYDTYKMHSKSNEREAGEVISLT